MDSEEDLEDLLLMLKETRGFDFTGYKRSALRQRVRRRMALVNLETFAEYRDFLELRPDEFGLLFDSVLINVTSFFRDPLAWQALQEQVLPELLSAKSAKSPIRVWSAGCATGEEAYTLAIVLAEELGPDQFRERVKIYATDLDEDALQQARTGAYEAKDLADVPDRLRDTYFEPSGGTKRAFRRDLRRQVIFERNDLTRDAPIPRVDLLVARNTLMYFNAEAQADVVRRFHFALSYPGYLFLGKAEMLLSHADRFTPVDLRRRLFRKALPAPLESSGGGWSDMSSREAPGEWNEGGALWTGYRRVRDELAYANTELERAYEELQSLNEELETTNEELQSTNEELQVINEELRGRTENLDQANSFLGSVLRSLGRAVIVLNEDLRVRAWSPGAEDLWGLRPEEAQSRELLSLDIGLPVGEIHPMLCQVLRTGSVDGGSAGEALRLSAVNRRGKTVGLQVVASPLRTEEGAVSGIILVIDQD